MQWTGVEETIGSKMIIEVHKGELERLIRQRMESGHFRDVEDALIQALRDSSSSGQSAARKKTKKPLGQFLFESPLRGSGLKMDRTKDAPRTIKL